VWRSAERAERGLGLEKARRGPMLASVPR